MSMAPGGALTGVMRPRMEATAPAISSTLSPLTRSAMRKPPIWLGVAPPDMMMSKACSASWRVSCAPEAALAMKVFMSAMVRRRPGGRCGR